MGKPTAHARAMQAKTSEGLEVLAAVVVTAGLVAGNLVLFSPLRVDNRVNLQQLHSNGSFNISRNVITVSDWALNVRHCGGGGELA